MDDNYWKAKVILVSQPFGDFFISSMPASRLVKVTHSLTASYKDGELDGVQRAINNKRIEDIAKFCQTERPLFPNSIILAANINESGDVVEEEDQWSIDKDLLVIPKDLKAASIVDGQHRIEGISKALQDGMEDFDLVCAIYMDLPTAKQAEVFATINFNQQKVDKSLAYQLFGYDLETMGPEYWAPDTLAISITRILNKQDSSPFRNHIGLGVKKADLTFHGPEDEEMFFEDPWKISTSTMVECISKLISRNPIRDRYSLHKKRVFKKDRSVLDLGSGALPPLRQAYLNFKDATIYRIVEDYFISVREHFWSDPDTILKKTIGIQALFDLLREILIRLDNLTVSPPGKPYFDSLLSSIDCSKIDHGDPNYSGSGRVKIRKQLLEQLKAAS
ncbi:DGQHR domain-containing protein [Azotobacter salinestris]|uniref:DGQHR domain-containing protein n=1 Tax=Azotobacter salinestris TaxID=69964 RepID=UPI0032DFD813